MNVQAPVYGMDPHTIAILWDEDISGLIDHEEILVGDIGQEFPDVQVDVALRAPLRGVERDAPRVVGPGLAGFGDGGAPITRALFGCHLRELLWMVATKARQRKPAVGLIGVGVAQ